MNIKERLEKEHSRELTLQIVSYIGYDDARFEELMRLVLGNQKTLAQRAAWSMSYVAIKYPYLLSSYLDELLGLIQKQNVHDAIVRNTLRALEQCAIPEKYQVLLIDICLTFVNDASKPAAIKAFSITVLENMCVQYPELAPEIASVLKDRIEFEKPAFKVRAKRFLNRFGIRY